MNHVEEHKIIFLVILLTSNLLTVYEETALPTSTIMGSLKSIDSDTY